MINDKKEYRNVSVVHLLFANNFTIELISFLEKNFSKYNITIVVRGNISELEKIKNEPHSNIKYIFFSDRIRKTSLKRIKNLMMVLYHSNVIITHGLSFIEFLYILPTRKKKVYWAIYGGSDQFNSSPKLISLQFFINLLRKKAARKIDAHLLIHRYYSDLANKFLNSKANFIFHPLYPSNIPQFDSINNIKTVNDQKEKIKILVGNSSSPSNNHKELFEIFSKYNRKDIELYCPLSYGKFENYKQEIITLGNKQFGNCFRPILEFMKIQEYRKFLQTIDVAVFNHERVEATGVIITLLGLGKTIYLNKKSSSLSSFKDLGFHIKSNDDIIKHGIELIEKPEKNMNKVKELFSEQNLINCWQSIYEEVE